MSYNSKLPMDDEYIASGPVDIRENFRALKEDQLVDAGTLAGLSAGNASGTIPKSNGIVNTNLNADLLDGYEANAFATASHTHSAATTSTSGFMSAVDKTKMDGIATGAQVNQNAFGNVVVGTTTIQADSATDTLTLTAGTNISLIPDATNDAVTIALTGTVASAATSGACSGNSATATLANTAINATGSITGTISSTTQANFQGLQTTGIGTSTGGLGGIMVQNNGGTGASFMSFHRAGSYASYFGLDNDNQWAVGGWSYGAGRRLLAFQDQIPTSLPANGGTSSACSGNASTSSWTNRLNANTHAMGTYNVQPDWTGTYWRLRGYNGDTYHAGVQVAYADSAGNADTVDGYHASSLMGGFDAGHSFATNGYQKLSNGLIMQWGYLQMSNNVSSGTFPIAFPSACVNLTTNVKYTNAADWTPAVTALSNSGFSVNGGGGINYNYFWFAIGY